MSVQSVMISPRSSRLPLNSSLKSYAMELHDKKEDMVTCDVEGDFYLF